MIAARVEAAVFLLGFAALIASCDRSPPEPSPVAAAPVSAVRAGPALKAGDAACALPIEQFAQHRKQISGSIMSYPTNLVIVERTGRLRWNGEPVDRRRLGEFTELQAGMEPPPILAIEADADAPCAAVRETLATAVRIGRCSPRRCAFERRSSG